MAKIAKGAQVKGSKAGQLQSSEEFAEYLHAVSVPIKIAIVATTVFFVGLIAFCLLGSVPVTIQVAAVADSSGSTTCYVKAGERDDVEPGDEVEIDGATYSVVTVASSATCVDDSFDDYACKVGGLSVGDYVFLVTTDASLPQGVYRATLTKLYLQPFEVLFAS